MAARGPELETGKVVPGTRYQVVRPLGAGGMGFVYHVTKPPSIQGVLKLMSPELTADEGLRLRFFDEVRILAQLDHPNVVKVFDYDALPDGTPFYVMELLSGRTVRDVIGEMGRVPPRVAYEITRQLLEALYAAHTHDVPVVHRDVKPDNVFLHTPKHGEPLVKLIDFGVSALADRAHDGTFAGTWSYAAPEQIRGDKPTPASDLYAVGLVLYEMLAGVGPFDHHDDWRKVSNAQLSETPAPVTDFAPWVPAAVVELIAAALEKEPTKRPRDARAFAERLAELEEADEAAGGEAVRSGGDVATATGPRERAGSGAGSGRTEGDATRDTANPRATETQAFIARLATEPGIGPAGADAAGGADAGATTLVRDAFASQEADAASQSRKSRARAVAIAGGIVLVGLVGASAVLAKAGRGQASAPSTASASATTSAVAMAAASASASAMTEGAASADASAGPGDTTATSTEVPTTPGASTRTIERTSTSGTSRPPKVRPQPQHGDIVREL